MNLHLPQTEESRAEAAELMSITNNLITPRNGEPLVAATQDFITGAHLVTRQDIFYTKEQFCALVAYFNDAAEHIDLPLPAIIKPIALWTGKQIISIMVRPSTSDRSIVESVEPWIPEQESGSIATYYVNLISKEKYYNSKLDLGPMCPSEGYVLFRGGELLSGCLGKKTVGDGSKSSLFYVLIRDYGAAAATTCMSRLAKFCARFMSDRGFSIGINDVTPSLGMRTIKETNMLEGERQAQAEIDLYRNGDITLKPGCNALQSLESNVNGILETFARSAAKRL